MKKVSKFYLARHRKPKDLVKELQMIDVENERQKLRKIVSERKKKWKQVMGVPQLIHPNFNYIKKQSMQFSTLPCNASQQPFITQKVKRKLATSNRAYSSTPNLKAGIIDKKLSFRNDTEDSKILNRMFIEFDRLINEQTPGLKVKELKEIDKNVHLPSCNQKKNIEISKKAYFEKFTIDNYSFYKTNDYHSIPNLLTPKCKTDRTNTLERSSQDSLIQEKLTQRSMKPKWTPQKSRLLHLTKLKSINQNLESTTHDESSILNLSILSGSRHSIVKQKKLSRRSLKNYDQSKSRIKTQRLKHSKVTFAKNINSVEY